MTIGFLALSSIAWAQPTAADKETARRLMAEGRERRSQNDHKGALQSFMGADAIMHVTTTGLEVAREQAALGRLLEARDTALRVARTTPEPNEPVPFTRAREEAQRLSDDLGKKIPVITVQVSGAEPNTPVAVSVDGTQIPSAAAGAPRTVDPGHHVIVASSGKKEAKAEFNVAEAERRQVPLDLKGPATAPESVEKQPEKQSDAQAEPRKMQPGKPLMIGGFAVGGLGFVVGSVAGIVSLSKTSSIKKDCAGSVCPSSLSSSIDSARTAATVSNIGFGFAIAGAAVGVIGYLVWKNEEKAAEKKPDASPAALTVSPWVGIGSGGVSGRF